MPRVVHVVTTANLVGVVACAASGGHLATVRLPDAKVFPPGDAEAAAAALRSILPGPVRVETSQSGRSLVDSELAILRHVDRVLSEYSTVGSAHSAVKVVESSR